MNAEKRNLAASIHLFIMVFCVRYIFTNRDLFYLYTNHALLL
jgi:hypothetical protein